MDAKKDSRDEIVLSWCSRHLYQELVETIWKNTW